MTYVRNYDKERRYRESHREEIRAKAREKYWANIEERRAYNRAQGKRLRRDNPEKYREIRRRWDQAHPEKIAEYRERHRGKYKTQRALRDRKKRLRQLCGVTVEWYANMLEKQGGLCAICGHEETAIQKGRRLPLSVDHCHKTRKPRELLCIACNKGIGSLGDSVERLEKAVAYLRKHEA